MEQTLEQRNATLKAAGLNPLNPGGVIKSADLAPAAPMNLPPAPLPQPYAAATKGAIAGATTPPVPVPEAPKVPVPETPAKEPTFSERVGKYLGEKFSLTAPTSSVDEYNKLYASNDVAAKEKTVNDLTAQLNEINAATTAGQLGLETQDIRRTQGVVDRQQAQIAREQAIKALPITAALNAAQGRLESAKSNITTMLGLIKSDNEAKYKYQSDQIDYAMKFADADQKDALQKRKEELDAKKAADDRIADLRKSYIDAAIKVEDFATAGKLASAETTEDLQTISSTISSKVPDVQIVESDGGIFSVNKKTGQITTLKKSKSETENTPMAKALQQASSQENINNIDSIIGDVAIRSVVGPNMFGRFLGRGIDALNGSRSNFIAGVEQLRSQLTLDSLVNAKAKGATFGALSEGELKTLQSSASKLGTWAIKDKDGNVTGYNAKEADFKRELDKINNLAKLDFIIKGGDPASVNVVLQKNGKYVTRNSDGSVTELN
jgi:hypothetical protein